MTSLELSQYVDLTLPELAARFPALAGRGAPDRGPSPAANPPQAPHQRLRLQAQRASFPLVEVPPGNP